MKTSYLQIYSKSSFHYCLHFQFGRKWQPLTMDDICQFMFWFLIGLAWTIPKRLINVYEWILWLLENIRKISRFLDFQQNQPRKEYTTAEKKKTGHSTAMHRYKHPAKHSIQMQCSCFSKKDCHKKISPWKENVKTYINKELWESTRP